MTWTTALFHRLVGGTADPRLAWLRLAGAACWLVILTTDVRHRQPDALVVAEYVVFGAIAVGAPLRCALASGHSCRKGAASIVRYGRVVRERWRLAGPRWRAALIAVLLALVLLTMSAEIGIVSDSTRRILFALWAVTNLVVAFGVERQVDRTKNIPPPGRRA